MSPTKAIYEHPEFTAFEVHSFPKSVRVTDGGESIECTMERLPWLIEVLQHIQTQQG